MSEKEAPQPPEEHQPEAVASEKIPVEPEHAWEGVDHQAADLAAAGLDEPEILDGKPMKWLPVGLITVLASLVTSVTIILGIVLLVGLVAILGVASSSKAAVIVGAILLPGVVVGVIALNNIILRWMIRAFGYHTPTFWQTLVGTTLAGFVSSFAAIILYFPLGLLVAAIDSSNTVLIIMATLFMLVVPIALQVVVYGFAVSHSTELDKKVAKIVGMIFMGFVGFLALCGSLIILSLAGSISDKLDHPKDGDNTPVMIR